MNCAKTVSYQCKHHRRQIRTRIMREIVFLLHGVTHIEDNATHIRHVPAHHKNIQESLLYTQPDRKRQTKSDIGAFTVLLWILLKKRLETK